MLFLDERALRLLDQAKKKYAAIDGTRAANMVAANTAGQ